MRNIATALESIPHLVAFVDTTEALLDRLAREAVLMYYLPVTPAAALPFLAAQFDVLGFRGWAFADTEEKKRALLASALALHRKAGTPFAIRTAIQAVIPGVLGVSILKGVGIAYDGDFDYDGTQQYGGGFWANFSVRLDVDGTFDSSLDNLARIRSLVEAWKTERSNLVDVLITITA